MAIIHGFELEKEQDIPELHTHARLFRHVRTGARLLSLENEDENKVFGITFRTPPSDSTGVAHIMEHSVLCGSKKYPLKEPFIELVKGSLNTFLNAFTFPDKTCYPVASQNVKDFYNLIDVYIDAVFHPLIPPTTLQQEGWHYELENVDAPLAYKGVVFNEMKGVYSNPDDMLQYRVQASLFPDTLYSVDSGGDPRHIPDLTYAQFKAFHERYYHPTNAWIYFYGDDDPEERLRRMHAYLSEYEMQQVDSSIPLQPAFVAPRRMDYAFDPGEDSDAMKGMLVMNWLLTESRDPEDILALSMLAHILIGTPASPLRKALIDSGLGEDLAGIGLEGDLRQLYFSTGLKGVAARADGSLPSSDEIEKLILDTLQALAQGIEPDMVAAALNTVEFRLRENNTGSFPRGLSLMLRSLSTWLYGGDAIAPLAFESPLAVIKDKSKAGNPYFETLIERYFLSNPHRTTLTLKPKPGAQKEREEEEIQRLAQARGKMGAAELQKVAEQAHRLQELQQQPDSPEALASLPALTLQDLDKEVKRFPLEELEISGAKTLFHDLFTNGIIYFDLGFDLHTLPQELLPYVPLFGRALLEMGTKREDFVRLSQHIGRSTGGIRSASFTSSIHGADQGAARLFLRSKATTEQAGELLSILEDILLTARLDNRERFRQIVLEDKASGEAMLIPAGHRVVNSRLRARFNEADWAAEQMNGISQLFLLRELIKQIDADWPAVQERLETLRRILLNRRMMIFNVTLDGENWSSFKPQLAGFLDKLPTVDGTDVFVEWEPVRKASNEGLAIPAQVNYVGKGANLFELGYQLDGSIEVITKFLGTTWLWERVRVQGGAYGGFIVFDHRSGVCTYLSYRDPNLIGTLENYDRSAEFLIKLELDRAELIKSIIGTIGDMDAYHLPDAKGFISLQRYLTGEGDDFRQQLRDQVLNTDVQDFRAFGDVLQRLNETGSVVVMGSQEALAKANTEHGDWLEITKVL